MPRSIDRTGRKFKMLTVLERSIRKTKSGQWYWRCRCDCGGITEVSTGSLGRTQSCGCLQHRRGKDCHTYKHGLSSMRGTKVNKSYQREMYEKHKYGITKRKKQQIFRDQSGCCKICGYRFGQKDGDLKVDHDHKTGIVRGFLCDHCNRGLGYFRDSPSFLRNAARYLLNYALAR